MIHDLPSIPVRRFTPEIFTNIITAYAICAKIRNPCCHQIDPVQEFNNFIVGLSEHSNYIERLFGSSLGQHSKLLLHSVKKHGEGHIAFDFDTNTFDDSRKETVTMRRKFHQEVRRYLASL